MSHVKIPEQLRGLARSARRQKWTIRIGGTGHLIWESPSGVRVTTPVSPRSGVTKQKAARDLRKAGLREGKG